jgi:hypothetical protein
VYLFILALLVRPDQMITIACPGMPRRNTGHIFMENIMIRVIKTDSKNDQIRTEMIR